MQGILRLAAAAASGGLVLLGCTVAKVEPQVTATWIVQGATAATGKLTCNVARTEVP